MTQGSLRETFLRGPTRAVLDIWKADPGLGKGAWQPSGRVSRAVLEGQQLLPGPANRSGEPSERFAKVAGACRPLRGSTAALAVASVDNFAWLANRSSRSHLASVSEGWCGKGSLGCRALASTRSGPAFDTGASACAPSAVVVTFFSESFPRSLSRPSQRRVEQVPVPLR